MYLKVIIKSLFFILTKFSNIQTLKSLSFWLFLNQSTLVTGGTDNAGQSRVMVSPKPAY